MLKRQIGTLFLIMCLNLITMPTGLGAEITVSPASGTDAQISINNAISSVASNATLSNPGYILLTPGTYNISAPIVLQSNVVLKGQGNSTVIFANGSVCNTKKEHGYITGSDVSNVEISNLQFRSTASKFSDGGVGEYRDCIVLKSANNCRVHDILFTRYLYNDGVQVFGSTNITIYNLHLYSAAHDGVAFLSDSKNCRMHNCDVQVQTNTGVRVDDSANCEVDHNTFTSGTAGSGWCCVELENKLTNANIHHNIMHDFRGSSNSAGIGNVHASGSINVYDNVMWNVSPYIQVGSGTNILGPSDHNVANWVAKGYGYGSIDNPTEDQNPTDEQQSPVAGFTSNITSGDVPLTVQFTDTSTGRPTSWLWDFGDKNTSTDQNPKHTYTKEGNYTLSLTVNNTVGSNTVIKASFITVNSLRSPIAAFSASPTSGKATLKVKFSDKSTGGAPASWTWNFGDGKSSNVKNPEHKYSKAGKYTVSLTVKNSAGTNTAKKTNYITVK